MPRLPSSVVSDLLIRRTLLLSDGSDGSIDSVSDEQMDVEKTLTQTSECVWNKLLTARAESIISFAAASPFLRVHMG
jgi:hypothetical protein